MNDDRRYLRIALVAFALFVVVVILFFMAGCSLKSAQITHGALQVGDLASTAYGEARGGVEVNPIMQTNLPTRIALKSAATAGIIWMTSKVDRSGHPRLAKAVLVTLNVVIGGVIVNNVSVARGMR